jgi:hypothetical protein
LYWIGKRISLKHYNKVKPVVIVSIISLLSLIHIVPLLILDLNSNSISAMSIITKYITEDNNKINLEHGNSSESKLTLVADPIYSWIPRYVYNLEYDFQTYFYYNPIESKKALFVLDTFFIKALDNNNDSIGYKKILENYKNIRPIAVIGNNSDSIYILEKPN